MNKSNPLLGLVGNYGDSDEETDEDVSQGYTAITVPKDMHKNAGVHPPPIPHCPWSACYDENSGFTYYWNQQTNAVTWEAPPEYLLALKLAQHQLHKPGSTAVSAEEWKLYQKALVEKQAQKKLMSKTPITKPVKLDKNINRNGKPSKKRPADDDDNEKIELITSYSNSNSDSESNDETSPVKTEVKKATETKQVLPKPKQKKPKTKPQIVEYGPSLPPIQNYKVPIGPEIPVQINENKSKEYEIKKDEVKKTIENDDENSLLEKLKNKAKILQNLGGVVPSELQDIIQEAKNRLESHTTEVKDDIKSAIDTNIDDLLEEIEKKELPKAKYKNNSDNSNTNSPKPETSYEEIKPLFPSSQFIEDTPKTLFPSAITNTVNTEVDEPIVITEKTGTNLYLIDPGETIGVTSRKKRRIDIPQRKPVEATYTTKYSQYIEGFSSERTGLGFNNDDGSQSPKSTIKYGNGLTFTKGEVLNEDRNEDLEESIDLVKAKLEFLCQQQETQVSPVQEMLIQLQTLLSARAAGALGARGGAYVGAWARGARAALGRLEARAAPPGWTCHFLRSEGRYRYRREADGFLQWEYPATASMDMDICTTPPHPEPEEDTVDTSENERRVWTPPPPAWRDPSPPQQEPVKKEIKDELASFYSDIAELDKVSSEPSSASASPPAAPAAPTAPTAPMAPTAPVAPTAPTAPAPPGLEHDLDKRDRDVKNKRKTKVKISSSMGIKHKSVSSMVAKWQQVAEEIDTD